METADLRYIGAAWKMGSLNELDPMFTEEMTSDEFKRAFQWWVQQNFGIYGLSPRFEPEVHGVGAWTVLARSNRNIEEPVGFILGWVRGRVIEIGGMVWFPWATRRNVIEGAVNFFDKMRYEATILEFAQEKDKRFFEMIARHGVLRRVGTSYSIYPDERAIVFEGGRV